MQVKTFLLDYFQQNPGRNLIIPDNPLRIQDILRKAFAGSGFRLLLNGIDVLQGQMNATFFEVQMLFNKKNTRKGNDTVLEFLEFWQKTNKLFKVFFDSTLENKDANNRSKKKISTPESQRGRLSGVNNRNLSQNQKILEKSLLQSQAKQKSKKSFVAQQTMLENMVSNFYTCINKSKSNKDSKIIEKNIHKNINDFVLQLKESNLPFSRLIYKLQSQLPLMKLTQQTSTLMKALIKQYKLHPQKDAQYSQAILRNILYEYSNPTSAAKTVRKQKINPNVVEGELLTPISTVNTLKIGKKQSQDQIYKRKLNQLFESFSMAFKNRKGLTFDQMTDQFKKMDLNSWMSLNKKFNTINKLGTQQVHFIFKRFSHLGFLDFQRFKKAFVQLNTKLFGKDSNQGNTFFGFNTTNNQNNNKSVIHLPMIRNNSLKNQLTNLTSSHLNQNNSLSRSMMTQNPNKSNSLLYNKQSNIRTKQPQRQVDAVIQKLNTKIKQNKTKI